jgi:hypothetical protein
MAQAEIDYDGSTFRARGLLSGGEAVFSIPRGGKVELYATDDGGMDFIVLGKDGKRRPVSVEAP